MSTERSLNMDITNVRVRVAERGNERLCGYCMITIDDEFVVKDLRIIEGENGPFIAMPSRKNMRRCPKCKHKNHYKAKYCNECGAKFSDQDGNRSQAHYHIDIAHPITAHCRHKIQEAVLKAYEHEVEENGSGKEQHDEAPQSQEGKEYA